MPILISALVIWLKAVALAMGPIALASKVQALRVEAVVLAMGPIALASKVQALRVEAIALATSLNAAVAVHEFTFVDSWILSRIYCSLMYLFVFIC